MRYITPALLLISALVFQTSDASAIPMTFVANLSAANEIPPTASTATGFASVVLDPTAETIQVNVTFSGLTTPDTAAHIHCSDPVRADTVHRAGREIRMLIDGTDPFVAAKRDGRLGKVVGPGAPL